MIRFALCLLLMLRLPVASVVAQEARPMAPKQAAATMKMPVGFQATCFAAEPDVRQPIGFCVDDRARLWVAEAYGYPDHRDRAEGQGDRIVILEDEDGDGQMDKRTVFYDKLNYVTGIEVGFGGAWVVSPPYFYFIPDRDGDDRPDSEPQVLLDGLGNHANSHNLANGLAWGPDGWLYGTHGRTNWSLMGKPGTPEEQRTRFDGGVYRYHPLRHVWEPFADGTTNPWGIDWDDYGQGFVCNCVNPHLFHIIQGAHYEPWRNRKSSQFAYQRIPTIADHLHFVGTRNVRDGLGSPEEDAAGGGHAHCGTMIYLGDNWPQRYRNTLFTNNIHGKRINNDLLKRQGSTYVASHGPDVMRSEDPWFVGVTLAAGPAGEVYVSDWSDTGECHYVRNTQKQTGRIYRISYGDMRRPSINLASRSTAELVELQMSSNEWLVRHARRLLQERLAAEGDLAEAITALRSQLANSKHSVPQRLRALWTLHALDAWKSSEAVEDAQLASLLDDPSEHLRSWAVRLLCENGTPSVAVREKMVQLARTGSSPLVRLHLASALQRINANAAWPLVAALNSRAEDANDPALPLMIWYGAEPLVNDNLEAFVQLSVSAKLPLVSRNIARRVASLGTAEALAALVNVLPKLTSGDLADGFIEGMLAGLEGRRSVAMPTGWPPAYQKLLDRRPRHDGLNDHLVQLALVFNDPKAYVQLTAIVNRAENPAPRRREALSALVERRPQGLSVQLLKWCADETLQEIAIPGLARYANDQTAGTLLKLYGKLSASRRQDALQTLASRIDWGRQLVAAMESKQIPAGDVTAFTVRQLRAFDDKDLNQRLDDVWGAVRETPEERARLIQRYKQKLNGKMMSRADLARGEALFTKNCASCHRLFGKGGKIGPDLSGAQRTNLDYMLQNMLDPNAAVAKAYRMELFRMKSGRVVTGIVETEDDEFVKVFTINERLVLPKAEVSARKASEQSIMPEGMLEKLKMEEVRDLLGFLGIK